MRVLCFHAREPISTLAKIGLSRSLNRDNKLFYAVNFMLSLVNALVVVAVTAVTNVKTSRSYVDGNRNSVQN